MTPPDTTRLADWLRAHVAGFRGGVQLQPLAGGQSNPTYALDAGEHRMVLRRKPPGVLLASAHAVDREYRVTAALVSIGVPVPRVHALCEDDAVIGSAFVMMDRVDGRVFADPALPELAMAERAAAYAASAITRDVIYRLDVAAVGLAGHGKLQQYFSRQIARRARQYRASQIERLPAMEHLIDWLPAHLPPALDDEPGALLHGNYRHDNLTFHPTEPRVRAVIDRELSMLGPPQTDLGYHLMDWRVSPLDFRSLLGHDLAALGIPD